MRARSKTVKAESSEEKGPSVLMIVIKGSLIALSISLVGVLIFAFFIKYLPVANEAIRPINQVIKGISVFFGTYIALKKVNQMGLINGLLIGLLYTALAFVVFSILDGAFVFSRTLFNDLLFGGIIGATCGVMVVNLIKKR